LEASNERGLRVKLLIVKTLNYQFMVIALVNKWEISKSYPQYPQGVDKLLLPDYGRFTYPVSPIYWKLRRDLLFDF